MDYIVQALSISLIGILIVGSTLAVISLALGSFRFFFREKPLEICVDPEPPAEAIIEPIQEEVLTDDGEIVAAISAALAEYLQQDASSFRILSVKRSSAWQAAARTIE